MQALTNRENQVAGLLANGYTDKEIAAGIYVSYETVRTHRKNIYAKIGARNLADLTRWVFNIERRTVLSILLLTIVISMELFQMEALRNRTIKVPKIARNRSKVKPGKTFKL